MENETPKTANRIEWIDRWRGILIVQIVAFHVLGVACAYDADGGGSLATVVKWIENYHVIAFFALTGVVWTRKSSFVEFVCGKVRRLLVPYFVFGGVWALLFLLFARRFAPSYASVDSFAWWQTFASVLLCNGYPDGLGRRVVNALWFLPSMFGVSVAYYLIDRLLPSRDRQFLLLLPLFALWHILFCRTLPWDVNRIPCFMVFVILGRWLIPREPIRWTANHCLVGVGASLALYAIAGCHAPIRECFSRMGVGAWWFVFVTMLLVFASAVMAQSVRWNTLGVVGRASLGILVLHKFPILAIQAVPALRGVAFGNGGGYI